MSCAEKDFSMRNFFLFTTMIMKISTHWSYPDYKVHTHLIYTWFDIFQNVDFILKFSFRFVSITLTPFVFLSLSHSFFFFFTLPHEVLAKYCDEVKIVKYMMAECKEVFVRYGKVWITTVVPFIHFVSLAFSTLIRFLLVCCCSIFIIPLFSTSKISSRNTYSKHILVVRILKLSP